MTYLNHLCEMASVAEGLCAAFLLRHNLTKSLASSVIFFHLYKLNFNSPLTIFLKISLFESPVKGH